MTPGAGVPAPATCEVENRWTPARIGDVPVVRCGRRRGRASPHRVFTTRTDLRRPGTVWMVKGPDGFEPSPRAPRARVLPLHHGPRGVGGRHMHRERITQGARHDGTSFRRGWIGSRWNPVVGRGVRPDGALPTELPGTVPRAGIEPATSPLTVTGKTHRPDGPRMSRASPGPPVVQRDRLDGDDGAGGSRTRCLELMRLARCRFSTARRGPNPGGVGRVGSTGLLRPVVRCPAGHPLTVTLLRRHPAHPAPAVPVVTGTEWWCGSRWVRGPAPSGGRAASGRAGTPRRAGATGGGAR